eukprot:6195117-Pleurochrysis_carterae.AAC.3
MLQPEGAWMSSFVVWHGSSARSAGSVRFASVPLRNSDMRCGFEGHRKAAGGGAARRRGARAQPSHISASLLSPRGSCSRSRVQEMPLSSAARSNYDAPTPLFRKARREAEAVMRQLQEENSSLARQVRSLERTLEDMEQDLSRTKQSINISNSEARLAEEVARKAEEQSKRIHEEKNVLQEKLVARDEHARRQAELLAAANEEISRMKNLNGAHEVALQQQQEEVRKLHAELATWMLRANVAEKAYEEEKHMRSAEQQEGQHRAAVTQGQKQQLAQLTAHTHNLLKRSQEEQGALQVRLEQIQQQLEEERQKWTARNGAQQDKLAKLTGERAALASIAQRAAQQLRQLQEQNDDLHRRCEASEQELAVLKGGMHARQQQLEETAAMQAAENSRLAKLHAQDEEQKAHLEQRLRSAMRRVDEVNEVALQVGGLLGNDWSAADSIVPQEELLRTPVTKFRQHHGTRRYNSM